MTGLPCLEGDWALPEGLFTLIGLVNSEDFQKCMNIVEYLHTKMPHIFPPPFIRPMLEFDWLEYQLKAQRKYGGKLWSSENPFIAFVADEQIVTVEELQNYFAKYFTIKLSKDYECLALRGIMDIYEKYMELGRKFVYLTLSMNDKYFGCLIIMLYADILPKTCKNFIRKCRSKSSGYTKTRVHRIMRKSWIQFADFSLPIDSMSNENYVVPHNRRGVVSMCSNGPHHANKTQFFITLDSTPWMDYRYVAIGQIMQGETVIKRMENLPTYYDFPIDSICITSSGEFSLEDTALVKNIPKIQDYLDEKSLVGTWDVPDVRDVPSVMLRENYRNLKYCYFDDTCSHFPLTNVASSLISEPTLFSTYTTSSQVFTEPGEEEHEPNFPVFSYNKYHHDSLRSAIGYPGLDYLKKIDTSHVIDENYNINKYVEVDLKKHLEKKYNDIDDGEHHDSAGSPRSEKRTSKVSFIAPLLDDE